MTLLLSLVLAAHAGTSVTSLDSGTGSFETADLDCGTVESGSASVAASITLAGDVVATLDNLAVEVAAAHGSCGVSLDTATVRWDGGTLWSTPIAQSGSGGAECAWTIDLAYAPTGFVRDLVTSGTHDLEIEVTGELEDACSKISARVTGDLEFGTDWDGDGFDDVAVGGDDCDDDDPAISPDEPEVWYDGIDQDCDGNDDDQDGDGYALADDCDDEDASVHPGAAESCDGIDQDCNGTIDDNPTDGATWYSDSDGDGFGDPASGLSACEEPTGMTSDAQDCDDTDPSIHPGAEEVCDSVDQDCDGAVDEDAIDGVPWYSDGDGDGYGDPGVSVMSCAAPAGYTGDDTDCDDLDFAVNPGAAEVCDGFDNNCDGLIDDEDPGVTGGTTWYSDGDGDGYGAGASAYAACNPDFGDVAVGGDCDDLDPDVNPGASEIWYDGIDQDCDGNDTDQDGDGWDYLVDCDDTDPLIYPGALGWDGDCNELASEDPDWTTSGLDGSELYKGGGGCGCATTPSPGTAGWSLALVGLIGWRHRRRDTR